MTEETIDKVERVAFLFFQITLFVLIGTFLGIALFFVTMDLNQRRHQTNPLHVITCPECGTEIPHTNKHPLD